MQPNGRIVVAGYNSLANGNAAAALVRYNTDGSLDLTFGGNGIVTANVDNASNRATSVVIQSNGRILISRIIFSSIPGAIQTAPTILRYNADGSLKDSFGQFSSSFVGGNGLTLQPDGKVILVGAASVNGTSNFFTARYLGDALAARPKFDFDGDGKSDISVYRPSSGVWYLLNSASGFTAAQFGVSTDKLVPADYDGDGKTDIAVYRNGTWYLNRSSAGFTGIAFGEASDVPQPADFDGDGKAELVVYRPSNGTWYVLNLAANNHSNFQFGASTDKPVVADYDGDGKADYAVYRPSLGIYREAQPDLPEFSLVKRRINLFRRITTATAKLILLYSETELGIYNKQRQDSQALASVNQQTNLFRMLSCHNTFVGINCGGFDG